MVSNGLLVQHVHVGMIHVGEYPQSQMCFCCFVFVTCRTLRRKHFCGQKKGILTFLFIDHFNIILDLSFCQNKN